MYISSVLHSSSSINPPGSIDSQGTAHVLQARPRCLHRCARCAWPGSISGSRNAKDVGHIHWDTKGNTSYTLQLIGDYEGDWVSCGYHNNNDAIMIHVSWLGIIIHFSWWLDFWINKEHRKSRFVCWENIRIPIMWMFPRMGWHWFLLARTVWGVNVLLKTVSSTGSWQINTSHRKSSFTITWQL